MAAAEEGPEPLKYQVSSLGFLQSCWQICRATGHSSACRKMLMVFFLSLVCALFPPFFLLQTLALKVSIHCEGCKKKVKKVLHSIEGIDGVKTKHNFEEIF